jgi:hypothetical protein
MNKKISALIISVLAYINGYSQNGVSINSSGTSPNASSILDLSDNNNQGIILPNVALTASNTAGPITSPATGLLIWNTATAGISPNNVIPGLYYNSGTPAAPNWKRVSTGISDAWTLDGNNNGAFRLIGTNDNQPLGIETNGTEWVRIGTTGNVAIGTTTITSSAALDVTSTSRGVLLPRVELTATNAAGPVTSPVTSLLVYNTATAGVAPNNVTPGFYMWDGSAWLRFDVGNNIGDWKITGNSNTTAPTAPTTYGTSTVGANDNMLGTRNAVDVVLGTNSIEQMRLISGGRVAIGSATGTATAMLSVNTYTNALRDGIAIAMSGATANANGVSITAGNINANGFYYTNSTSALSSAVFGVRAELTSTNIVSGYAAYRNSSGKSYGLFGITGTNASYTSSNANTWAAFMQGRVVISGEGSPTSLLGTDLEVRNTTLGAGNPAVISIRQGTTNTAAGTILGNLNFGDDYVNTPQAQIQISRSALSSTSTDLPTDIIFKNTPDNSSTLTERMRISQNGNVGMGTSTIPAESRLVLGAIDGVNEGGQLQINAPGGSFNTAFFIDNYQNSMRILTGTNSGSATQALSVSSTGVVNISNLSPSLAVYTDASRNLTTTVPTSGQLGYWTRSGTLLWNTNTGDFVGIGTTTPGRTLEVNGDICIPSVSGNKSIYTWANNDANWRIGMSNSPGFTRALATSHVEFLTFASGAGQGFAVGDVVAGLSAFEVGSSGSGYNAYFRGNVGINNPSPGFRLDVTPTAGTGTGIRVSDNGSNPGVQLLTVGDDAFFTDIDQAHTLGLYSTSDATMGVLRLGNGSNVVRTTASTQQGVFGQALNMDFDDVDNTTKGVLLEGGDAESGGFFANGNTSAIWSPGDGTGGILSVYDEDNMGASPSTVTPAMRITGAGNMGINTGTPAVRLSVNGSGTNVYNTDIWAENNIHVQGNETMAAGGRGRLRVGSAWGYMGLYTDATSTSANNDLILGSSTGWTRIGPGSASSQSLWIPNGTGQANINNATSFAFQGYNGNASGTGVVGSGNNLGANYPTTGAGGAFSGTRYGSFSVVPATTSVGTDYRWSSSFSSVVGYSPASLRTGASASAYQFGVTGSKDLNYSGSYYYDLRSGGVLGNVYRTDAPTNSWGSLGYFTSGSGYVGVYGSSTGSGTGFSQAGGKRIGVGGAFYGDFMGSWTRGDVLGFTAAGEVYASYNIGNEYTSGKQIELVSSGDEIIPAYSQTSLISQVTASGKAKMENGLSHIKFPENLLKLIQSDESPEITVTPYGDCNGVHISEISKEGFTVKENRNGNSTIMLTWIIVAKRKDADIHPIHPDLLKSDFVQNMKKVMFDESIKEQSAQPAYWDGEQIQFKYDESSKKVRTAGQDNSLIVEPASMITQPRK